MGKLSPSFSLFPQPGNGKISSYILYSDIKVHEKKLKWPFSIFHRGRIVSSCQVHTVNMPIGCKQSYQSVSFFKFWQFLALDKVHLNFFATFYY